MTEVSELCSEEPQRHPPEAPGHLSVSGQKSLSLLQVLTCLSNLRSTVALTPGLNAGLGLSYRHGGSRRSSLGAYELAACLATRRGTVCKGRALRPSQSVESPDGSTNNRSSLERAARQLACQRAVQCIPGCQAVPVAPQPSLWKDSARHLEGWPSRASHPSKSDHQQLSSGKCASNLKWNHRDTLLPSQPPTLASCWIAKKQRRLHSAAAPQWLLISTS